MRSLENISFGPARSAQQHDHPIRHASQHGRDEERFGSYYEEERKGIRHILRYPSKRYGQRAYRAPFCPSTDQWDKQPQPTLAKAMQGFSPA